jgi:ABC-type transport system involved in multi-copper enzyme maturation permease subunit
MNLRAVFAIARIAVVEQIRNRLYLIILFFGALILAASILMGALAPSYRVRVIFDLGLVAIELFGLATAVFGAVTLVLQEIESKTIYLLMTRPLSRTSYIVGRFLGLIVAVVITMVAMSALHLGILFLPAIANDQFSPLASELFRGTTPFGIVYPLALAMSIGKMFVTAAVALFFSLFASSSVSALVFTGFFWITGHFTSELSFMIDKTFSPGPVRTAVHWISAVFPNFHYFNYRDTYAIPHGPGASILAWALLYGFAYTGFLLMVSSYLFSRKEF